MTRVHTDPTNAARVRQEQTDAKTLTRSQNEYESITFEQCCEQVPNEAAVEAELEEHAYNLVLILTRHTLARAGLANRLF